MAYQIITDSTTDLSPELIEKIHVSVIPMEYNMGDHTYRNWPDYREQSSRDFYNLLRSGTMSSTNQINLETFRQTFTPLLVQGLDILYLGFSSGLSGTFNSSLLVARELREQFPDRKIEVVDTLAASFGEGLLVYLAGLKKNAGASLEEVRDWVVENRSHLGHWFTVDDLNHLKRGGRVGSATAFVGTMLSIKPVLIVDDEGHLTVEEKIRGRKQSLDALVRHMQQMAVKPEEQTVFIGHGDCLEDAEYVADRIRKELKVPEVVINSIGPVIGSHSGPGTVALFFLATGKK